MTTNVPEAAPAEDRARSAFQKIRLPAALTLLAVNALWLLLALVRLLVPGADRGDFGGRSLATFGDFSGLPAIVLPLLAVLLVMAVRPALGALTRPVLIAALAEYGVSMLFGLVTFLGSVLALSGRVMVENAFEQLGWLALLGVAALGLGWVLLAVLGPRKPKAPAYPGGAPWPGGGQGGHQQLYGQQPPYSPEAYGQQYQGQSLYGYEQPPSYGQPVGEQSQPYGQQPAHVPTPAQPYGQQGGEQTRPYGQQSGQAPTSAAPAPTHLYGQQSVEQQPAYGQQQVGEQHQAYGQQPTQPAAPAAPHAYGQQSAEQQQPAYGQQPSQAPTSAAPASYGQQPYDPQQQYPQQSFPPPPYEQQPYAAPGGQQSAPSWSAYGQPVAQPAGPPFNPPTQQVSASTPSSSDPGDQAGNPPASGPPAATYGRASVGTAAAPQPSQPWLPQPPAQPADPPPIAPPFPPQGSWSPPSSTEATNVVPTDDQGWPVPPPSPARWPAGGSDDETEPTERVSQNGDGSGPRWRENPERNRGWGRTDQP